MKRSILLITFFALLSIGIASATEVEVDLTKVPPTTYPRIPRASFMMPLTAIVIDMELYLNFTTSVGLASISILDENGSIVYLGTLDTDSESELIISLESLYEGDHILIIEYDSVTITGMFSQEY